MIEMNIVDRLGGVIKAARLKKRLFGGNSWNSHHLYNP